MAIIALREMAGYEAHIVPSDQQDYAYSVLIDKTQAQDAAQSAPILDVMGMLPGSVISSPEKLGQ